MSHEETRRTTAHTTFRRGEWGRGSDHEAEGQRLGFLFQLFESSFINSLALRRIWHADSRPSLQPHQAMVLLVSVDSFELTPELSAPPNLPIGCANFVECRSGWLHQELHFSGANAQWETWWQVGT